MPTGRVSKLLVTPTIVSADEEELRSLSIEERNCRFGDELHPDMAILREYSRKGCRLEFN